MFQVQPVWQPWLPHIYSGEMSVHKKGREVWLSQDYQEKKKGEKKICGLVNCSILHFHFSFRHTLIHRIINVLFLQSSFTNEVFLVCRIKQVWSSQICATIMGFFYLRTNLFYAFSSQQCTGWFSDSFVFCNDNTPCLWQILWYTK